MFDMLQHSKDVYSMFYTITRFFWGLRLCAATPTTTTTPSAMTNLTAATHIGYLNIDIKGYIYICSLATTSINRVRIVTSVHATPVATAIRSTRDGDGTRKGRSRHNRCQPIRDAGDDGKAEKTTGA